MDLRRREDRVDKKKMERRENRQGKTVKGHGRENRYRERWRKGGRQWERNRPSLSDSFMWTVAEYR